MSDPLSTAKSARESLARALQLLQPDGGAPAALAAAAEPVSRAMGALFQIEKGGKSGLGAAIGQQAPVALQFIRQALGLVQSIPSAHPSGEKALEAIAEALSMVHKLTNFAAPPPVAAPPAPSLAATQVSAGPVHAASIAAIATAQGRAPEPRPPTAPAVHQQAPVPKQAPHAAPAIARNPTRVEAELGTHSASNFYKGLAGNDVVEHGGLFISTYNTLPIGQPIALRVSLPGGYEFEAIGVVKWTRETRDGGAEPGYGAQFTHISPEARQLVYRYVRNREPLFYDDL